MCIHSVRCTHCRYTVGSQYKITNRTIDLTILSTRSAVISASTQQPATPPTPTHPIKLKLYIAVTCRNIYRVKINQENKIGPLGQCTQLVTESDTDNVSTAHHTAQLHRPVSVHEFGHQMYNDDVAYSCHTALWPSHCVAVFSFFSHCVAVFPSFSHCTCSSNCCLLIL